MKRDIIPSGLLLMISLLMFSCTGIENSPEESLWRNNDYPWETAPYTVQEYMLPEGLGFSASPLPTPSVPPGIGEITREQNDPAYSLSSSEKARISGLYRDAYIDALLQDIPISGSLGGDFVHGWSGTASNIWVQNWRSSRDFPNSWGIPSLILAVYGHSQDKVFMISGGIMDSYGKSAGINHVNGVKGYGSPCTDDFIYKGKRAQRFDLGIIYQNEQDRFVFQQENPPSANTDTPPQVGELADAPQSMQIRIKQAFLNGWKLAVDRNMPLLIPDAPVIWYDLSASPWIFGTQETLLTVNNIYLQPFNNGSIVLVLVDSPAIPWITRIVESPFVDALILASKQSIPGTPGSRTDQIPPALKDAFSASLLKGFEIYGVPVTNSMLKDNKNMQRFAYGWMELEILKETAPTEQNLTEITEE